MFANLPEKQKLICYAAGAVVLFFACYIGSARLRPEPKVEIIPTVTGVPQPVTPPPSPNKEVVVHVAGAVKKPGVIHLSNGARVNDAIEKAGGPTAEASLDEINLAAVAQDGTQILVPKKGAAVPATMPQGEITPYTPNISAKIEPISKGGSKSHNGGKHPEGTISLTTSTAEQLQTIPGIGPSTAERIIAYRQEHGGFSSVEELLQVGGIGNKKLEKIRKWLRP